MSVLGKISKRHALASASALPLSSSVRPHLNISMKFDYVSQIQSLNEEKRLHFYEVLAHNLTVSIRSIWSTNGLSDSEKLEQIKAVNEILHQVTSKVWVTRLHTHEWSEADMWSSIRHSIGQAPEVAGEIESAIDFSFNAVQK
jgi:hypothetical protein